jgi:hypothetical protein
MMKRKEAKNRRSWLILRHYSDMCLDGMRRTTKLGWCPVSGSENHIFGTRRMDANLCVAIFGDVSEAMPTPRYS